MTTDLPPVFPPQLQSLATEVRTYFRELPQLLAGGHDRRFVVGRRFVGHEVLEKLKVTKTAPEGFSARTLNVRFAAGSLGAGRYHVRDLLNDRDLGSFGGDVLMQAGVEVELVPGEAVYWEARPVETK